MYEYVSGIYIIIIMIIITIGKFGSISVPLMINTSVNLLFCCCLVKNFIFFLKDSKVF